MNTKIFHAKYESLEFVLADALLVLGGFLLGTNFQSDNTTILGTISIAIGLFFGLRVLFKFSSDLKSMRNSVNNSNTLLQRTNDSVITNKKLVENATGKLNLTINNLDKAKKELEQLQSDIYPRNTVTDPNLLIRRIEKIENYTTFDIEKQPILMLYQRLISNPKPDFKSIQDFKLIKLFSLVYKLVSYNNSLLYYKGSKILFYPLIDLMKKKNRLYYLCTLKIHNYKGEIDLILEQKMSYLVAICYNSMIDSQNIGIKIGDPDMVVKEHSVKVSEVNEKFKELAFDINAFLTVKFPDEEIEKISKIEYPF